jgi:hypothetical protein
MARKPTHFTTHTNEEMHLRFKAAVEQLGMGVDNRESKLHDLTVDGVRLGDRLAEMRKPGTSFYGQSYVEARSAARLMVDLGWDQRVRDIRRLEPPAPDVEVVFDERASIYIEQTMVMDDAAHRLSTTVDSANAVVMRMAATDLVVGHALDAGLLTIRLDRLTPAHLELMIPADDLADEICALARTLRADVSLMRPDPMTQQLLHKLGAQIFYRLGLKTGSPIQPPMDHGRVGMLGPALRKQLRKKVEKAQLYAAKCRPLWLVLDIDHHFGIGSFERIARDAVASETPGCFERTVVQQVRYAPILIEP